jgi:hypothetical protein
MELELHIALPSGARATLTGTGTNARRMTFNARGDRAATDWLKEQFTIAQQGYTGYEGAWAGRIGGKLFRLMDVLMTAQHHGHVTVAIIRMPSKAELPPLPRDEMEVPPELRAAIAARRKAMTAAAWPASESPMAVAERLVTTALNAVARIQPLPQPAPVIHVAAPTVTVPVDITVEAAKATRKKVTYDEHGRVSSVTPEEEPPQ